MGAFETGAGAPYAGGGEPLGTPYGGVPYWEVYGGNPEGFWA
jgi:hypothetical protein